VGAIKQMNERIRELLVKARESTKEGKWNAPTSVWAEKFAELIVTDCAGIYDKIDNGNLHMGTDNYLEALHKTFRS
jgi:hypothetical protein